MSQPVVDTLQLCDALRKTGMEREQAEGIARALGDELGAHVVAQGDLQTGFLEVRGEIQSVDHRVDLARTELVGQIRILDGKVDSVRTELGGRIDALDGKVDSVRTELGGRIDALDGKVDSVSDGAGRPDRRARREGRQRQDGAWDHRPDRRADDGKVDSVRTEVGGEIKALRTTLGIVGGAIGLLLTGVGLVAGTALLRPPAPAPWYGPPPAAVSAPTLAPAAGSKRPIPRRAFVAGSRPRPVVRRGRQSRRRPIFRRSVTRIGAMPPEAARDASPAGLAVRRRLHGVRCFPAISHSTDFRRPWPARPSTPAHRADVPTLRKGAQHAALPVCAFALGECRTKSARSRGFWPTDMGLPLFSDGRRSLRARSDGS